MPSFIDLTGKEFGCWLVLDYAGRRYWRCRCSCGAERLVFGGNLRAGSSASCGRGHMCEGDARRQKRTYRRVA